MTVNASFPRYRDVELLATRRVITARRRLLAGLTTYATLVAATTTIIGSLIAGLPVGINVLTPARGVIAWIALGILATVLFGAGGGWFGVGATMGLTVFYGYDWSSQPRFWNIMAADADNVSTWSLTAGLVVAALIAARISPQRSGLA
ncbi:hypothetical protein [Sanguibacter antarcticus]|uniref:hypothetical protein n=1 Tax=Sanguibacter antarcticus TaxID=372484 RepID=UPI0011798EE2|nr:hypothetical protein [Sanguibacter antarcticus]